jgi:hypothetical protein
MGDNLCDLTSTVYPPIQCTPLHAVGVVRGADTSLTEFHPLQDEILSQNLQVIADQVCHLEGSSPYKGTNSRGVYCSRISISGTAFGSRKLTSGRFPVRSGSCHRQTVTSSGIFLERVPLRVVYPSR